jgi:ribosome-binding ATPase YchF (GTP1/OBG family)
MKGYCADNMLIGIVGKPSCGKSSFFKAATLAEVDIANYPFTTIKPNHAVSYVKVECADKFFNTQCNPRTGYCLNHTRYVPVELLDVAGLVPGAHEGLGMGNQFLDDLRQADVLIHVIDVSGSVNERGEPVTPLSYDPINDVRFLETELDYWYLDILQRGWKKFAQNVIQLKLKVSTALAKQLSAMRVTEDMVEQAMTRLGLQEIKPTDWTEAQMLLLATDLRKKTKPMLIACNKVDVPGAEKNYEKLKQMFKEYNIIPCSAECEMALREAAKQGLIEYIPGDSSFKVIAPDKLSDKQKHALDFVKKNILDKFGSTGIQQVLDYAIFNLLGYIAIFPGGLNKLTDSDGNVLPDCFLLPRDSTALDFAYKLHTDFGKNFIRAINVKTRMTVGRDYKLKNGDVIELVCGK